MEMIYYERNLLKFSKKTTEKKKRKNLLKRVSIFIRKGNVKLLTNTLKALI